jgi:hypothetical protein
VGIKAGLISLLPGFWTDKHCDPPAVVIMDFYLDIYSLALGVGGGVCNEYILEYFVADVGEGAKGVAADAGQVLFAGRTTPAGYIIIKKRITYQPLPDILPPTFAWTFLAGGSCRYIL